MPTQARVRKRARIAARTRTPAVAAAKKAGIGSTISNFAQGALGGLSKALGG